MLQDQEFERLGSTRAIRVNIRLIAATNRDLAQSIASRQFRRSRLFEAIGSKVLGSGSLTSCCSRELEAMVAG